MKKNKKKNIVYMVLFVLLILLIVISSSYAYFKVNTTKDSTLGSIVSDLECIDISYSETNVIDMSNKYPVTDEYALSNYTPVTVTITNNCSENINKVNYTLTLSSLSENNNNYIPDNKMRINVKRTLPNAQEETYKGSNYVNTLAPLEEGYTYNYLSQELNRQDLTKDYANKTIYRIDNNVIDAGEEVEYKIYLWIDYWEGDTTETGLLNNSTMNKTYKAAINLVVNTYENKSTEGVFLGSGSSETPYKIQTIEDLVRLSNSVNDGETYEGMTFALTRNLDFNDKDSYEDADRIDFGDINGDGTISDIKTELTTGTGFQPIGNLIGKKFSGIFKGNYNEIKNLYIDYQDEQVNYGLGIGLFGRVESTSIDNLGVIGTINYTLTKTTDMYIGGLIGIINSNSNVNINNCHTNVIITGNASHNTAIDVGGLIGNVSSKGGINLNIYNSYSKSNIASETGNNLIGGLVGFTGNNIVNISNSYNDGMLNNESGSIVGGFIASSYATVTISNSENKNNVICNACNAIGGLVGKSEKNLIIVESNNNGNITSNTSASTSTYLGGLVGRSNNNLTIQNSYNSGILNNEKENATVGKYTGGLVGLNFSSTAQTKIINSYNNGQIQGGNRVGGLIGVAYSETIIDKSYNNANISSATNWGNTTSTIIGGLIGQSTTYDITHEPITILNSYNDGNMSLNNSSGNAIIGGLVGTNSGNVSNNRISTTSIINSYNAGSVNSNSYSIGIARNSNNGITNLNNVFNYGELISLNSNGKSYGIGSNFDTNPTLNINNSYYNKVIPSILNTGTNSIVNGTATGIYKSDFNTQSFVDTLNSNISNIDLTDYGLYTNEYSLSTWSLGPNEYPILNNN